MVISKDWFEGASSSTFSNPEARYQSELRKKNLNPATDMIMRNSDTGEITGFQRNGNVNRKSPREEMWDWYKNQQEENRELATEAWDKYRQGVDRANEETREDRDDVLARLDSYEEGYNEDWMNSVLAQEKAQWEAKRQQTLDRVQQQYANMGRQASPYLLGEINRRMTAQEADALQARRFELEQERDSRRQWALQLRNQIYSNTQRQVMNPQVAASMMQTLGQGASTVAPAMANAG